jgi:hypothetical protein
MLMYSFRIDKLKQMTCTRNDVQFGLGDPAFDDVRILDWDQYILISMDNQNRTFYLG